MSTDQSRKRWPLRRVSGGTCTLCELDATVSPRDELTSVIDADLKRKNGCALGQLRRNKAKQDELQAKERELLEKAKREAAEEKGVAAPTGFLRDGAHPWP